MQDGQMLDMLKPCIEEGFVVQEQEVSVQFIVITHDHTTAGRSP
jgi:hypothetical protein